MPSYVLKKRQKNLCTPENSHKKSTFDTNVWTKQDTSTSMSRRCSISSSCNETPSFFKTNTRVAQDSLSNHEHDIRYNDHLQTLVFCNKNHTSCRHPRTPRQKQCVKLLNSNETPSENSKTIQNQYTTMSHQTSLLNSCTRLSLPAHDEISTMTSKMPRLSAPSIVFQSLPAIGSTNDNTLSVHATKDGDLESWSSVGFQTMDQNTWWWNKPDSYAFMFVHASPNGRSYTLSCIDSENDGTDNLQASEKDNELSLHVAATHVLPVCEPIHADEKTDTSQSKNDTVQSPRMKNLQSSCIVSLPVFYHASFSKSDEKAPISRQTCNDDSCQIDKKNACLFQTVTRLSNSSSMSCSTMAGNDYNSFATTTTSLLGDTEPLPVNNNLLTQQDDDILSCPSLQNSDHAHLCTLDQSTKQTANSWNQKSCPEEKTMSKQESFVKTDSTSCVIDDDKNHVCFFYCCTDSFFFNRRHPSLRPCHYAMNRQKHCRHARRIKNTFRFLVTMDWI